VQLSSLLAICACICFVYPNLIVSTSIIPLPPLSVCSLSHEPLLSLDFLSPYHLGLAISCLETQMYIFQALILPYALVAMRRALVIAIPLLLASIGGLVILAWTCFRRSPNRPPKKSSRRAVSTRAQLTRQVCFNTSAMARLDIPLPPLL
jgi:hypothetical protein